MDFIIGGAYQGKLTWAMAQYPLKPEQLLDLGRSEPRRLHAGITWKV